MNCGIYIIIKKEQITERLRTGCSSTDKLYKHHLWFHSSHLDVVQPGLKLKAVAAAGSSGAESAHHREVAFRGQKLLNYQDFPHGSMYRHFKKCKRMQMNYYLAW